MLKPHSQTLTLQQSVATARSGSLVHQCNFDYASSRDLTKCAHQNGFHNESEFGVNFNLRISCVKLRDKIWINLSVIRNSLFVRSHDCGRSRFVHFFCSVFPIILHRLKRRFISVFQSFFTLSTALTKTTIYLDLYFKSIIGGAS